MKTILFILLITLSPLVSAQYKCEESGRTWYTDTPCQNEQRPPQRTKEQNAAAEIQAAFERDVAAKLAADVQAQVDNHKQQLAATAEKTEKKPEQPTQPTTTKPHRSGWSIWNLGILGLVLGLMLYITPALVAFSRNHHQCAAITIVNLFLGWTFIGWVGALAWSVSSVKKQP